MLNKVYLAGNLGNAPDIRTTQDGREIATLSLATRASWKNEQGVWQYGTDWHRIMIFREETVQWVKKSLRKGDSLLIEGKLSYSEFEDKMNQKRKVSCVLVSGREGQVHLLRSGKATEKETLSLYQEEDNLSFIPTEDRVGNGIQDIPFLKNYQAKMKFKERNGELTDSLQNNMTPLHSPSSITGENLNENP